jgi:ribosomal protein S18 acetylase RimI-like enzyme
MIKMRELTVATGDWHAICNIYEAAAPQELSMAGIEQGRFRPLPEEEPRDKFFRINEAMVACLDHRIVGFVAWRDGGFISWLYVDPSYHRRGIGSRLLDEAMNRVGGDAWTLAKDGNTPAIELYRKRGMETVRSYPADYWGCPFTEIRLALPTSNKRDPNVPNFGA